jgi:hypothetical protein
MRSYGDTIIEFAKGNAHPAGFMSAVEMAGLADRQHWFDVIPDALDRHNPVTP